MSELTEEIKRNRKQRKARRVLFWLQTNRKKLTNEGRKKQADRLMALCKKILQRKGKK